MKYLLNISSNNMDENADKWVLIVEDEQDAREIYVDILTANGFNVDSAVDGMDAEEKLMSKKYNLILLDIITPRKDGIQTLAEIKSEPEKYGTPKVVMLSNIAGDVSIDKAMELGADGYMLKSEVPPEELINIVNKYI